MRRFLIVLSILVILVTSVSCLPTSSKTSQKDIDQDTVISDLKTTVSSLKETRVSTETFNGLKDRVTALENKSTTATTTYTKTEVDAAISQAITNAVNNLKNDQSWVKGTTTTPTSTSPTGTVTFATTPAAIGQLYSASSGGSQSVFYTMKIVNNSSTWQYVKPVITMSVQSSYSSRAVTGITVTMSSGSCSLTGSRTSSEAATSSIGNFSISPNVGNGATSTSSLTVIPISGCNGTGEFQVGSGQSVDILIQISNITTSDVTLWNITNSISNRSL
jgi:hypothetical protein